MVVIGEDFIDCYYDVFLFLVFLIKLVGLLGFGGRKVLLGLLFVRWLNGVKM